ncbi:hypothetical protein QNI16_34475 [Cytophagaceae bacterium YF14B1]|uniref:NIPSNAP family protein n=1 Tax=Xanthocytophaga flava TaxID=3048013 RepID=A0AAE3R021_9BACT|nr:hypothetical protein [Xanthocytophaga flavus]MDJ1485648.1 hypothetical protein [Xanthocytophaga flavus]
MENSLIKVLEIRNYLLEANTTDRFIDYFDTHFVEKMQQLGGYTLGEFIVKDQPDRFVWLRGFSDMQKRLTFLNDFYMTSDIWKKFGPGANEMMINSDNVHLLRPLQEGNQLTDPITHIESNSFPDYKVATIDYYIANTRLPELVDLFNTSYLPFLKSTDIRTVSLWVSESSPNDFPRLPAFQDPNLLVAITFYATEDEYKIRTSQLRNTISPALERKLQEVVTTHTQQILFTIQNNYSKKKSDIR